MTYELVRSAIETIDVDHPDTESQLRSDAPRLRIMKTNTATPTAHSPSKHSLHRTKNDLPEPTRAKIVELLNSHLASGIDLYLQTKQAHWNVKGPSFIALHELFDKVASTVQEAVDDMAERVVQLGGSARGTLQAAGKATSLKEYPIAITDSRDHVDALSSALATFGSGMRDAIETATDLDDAGTADLFTQVSREIDKQLWFVEAHAQGK
jgi:starvation-inducible DNA-binding protein